MKPTPVSVAVVVSLFIASLILAIGAAVGGSYWLIVNNNHHEVMVTRQIIAKQASVAEALRKREAESSIRTTIPVCQAVVDMDDASHGASNASKDSNSYGHRLARAIAKLDSKSHCALLISLVHKGYSVTQIEKIAERLQNGG